MSPAGPSRVRRPDPRRHAGAGAARPSQRHWREGRWSRTRPHERSCRAGEQGCASNRGGPPHRGEIPRGDHRVGRQPVDLRLIEQEEERPGATDAVIGIGAVELRLGDARGVERIDSVLRAHTQLIQIAVLDRLRRACLRAGRGHAVSETVVAQGALLCDADIACARRALAAVDDTERARRDAVPAAIANVVLHHNCPELGAHERPGGTHVEAGSVGAVLADIRRHQPANAGLRAIQGPVLARSGRNDRQRCEARCGDRPSRLLDEGDMAPRARPETTGVVVRHAEHLEAVLGDAVPLLAGDLARLAPDADRAVSEESLARRRVLPAGVGRGIRRPRPARHQVPSPGGVIRVVPVSTLRPARCRYASTKRGSAAPVGRRPGWISHAAAFDSWMWTLGSRLTPIRSFAESPLTIAPPPPTPQWYGRPIWWMTRPPTVSGVSRSVTRTLASMAVRAVTMVAQPRCSSPRSAASSGDTSQKNSGCSSARYGDHRLMPPAVWCSVRR